jgi:hypothetical protein
MQSQFEYLNLSIKIECNTFDLTHYNAWRKIIYELKLYRKQLFGVLYGCDMATGTVRHHIYTYVKVFSQGRLRIIKQEGDEDYEDGEPVTEDTLLEELSTQLTHYGLEGWELVEAHREDKIDDYRVLYRSGRRSQVYQVSCILKRLSWRDKVPV